MTSRRARRLVRVFGLRCLRIGRRHWFSGVSVAVIAGAFALAMTSTGFDAGGDRAAQGPAAAVTDSAVSDPLSSPASPVQPSASDRTMVYYIVDTYEQWEMLRQAMRSDAIYLARQGMAPLQASVYYMLFRTPEEEADGSILLAEMALLAPEHGFELQVVDLRR